jgi:asparagine synthase (glutamine-hydrolysing)
MESHLNVYDGLDRAVVRRAFDRELPRTIVERTDKGTPGLWIQEVVNRNIKFVREFLLDGALVKERLVDPCKLDLVLGNAPTRLPHREAQVIRLLYNEAWMRNWTSLERRVAA